MKISDLYKLKIQKKLFKYKLSSDHTYYLLSIIVGIFSGLVAVLIHKTTSFISHAVGTDKAFTLEAWAWGGLFILISGYLTTRHFNNTSGSGIPMVKVWLVAKSGYIRPSYWISKLITTILSLSSGMSIGREGPTVSVSAGVGSTFAQFFSLPKKRVKSLVAQACSGGVAAAFNTPIAAIFFTLEEVVGDMNAKTMGPIVISAVVASFTSYLFLGNHSVFPQLHYSLTHNSQLLIYLTIGIASAFLGPLWVNFVLKLRQFNLNVFRGHRLTIMLVSFGVVGFSGLYFYEILGSGHHIIGKALLGELVSIKTLLILFVLKFVLTGVSYSSGISGGLFMPTLFIGAMLGALVASIFAYFFPDFVGGLGPYALVGMGAYFVSVIKTPFTSIMIIFELTHDYNIIIPLMLANMSSYLISNHFNSKSIYEALSEQNGIHLPTREDDDILDQLHVEDAMMIDVKSLDYNLTLKDALKQASELGFSGYPIVFGKKLKGLITTNELRELVAHDKKDERLDQYCKRDIITIYPDQSLLMAFHKLKQHHVGRLFVVSRLNHHELLGLITAEDIVSSFGFHIKEEEDQQIAPALAE